MKKSKKQVTTFVVEGRFLETLGKSPLKPKYIRIGTASGEQLLKLGKEVRPLLINNPFPVGTWVTLSGKETYKPKKGIRKRKIDQIEPQRLTTAKTPCSQPTVTQKPAKSKKENILVCQKSSCCKRGGKAVYQAAMEAVEKHQLRDRVNVKPTGCMGKCKKGPCLVMQANKSRHLGLKPEQVPELIAQQYAS
ncbi:MAG: (2Fe-2S) ferredoxin domain-containing protein [Halothece sp. Uz-M2-17]|nr:(2Fe-2S) ferredoxin domain-containing protein [Halothece sp. Uz-M2-17]